MLSVLTFNHKMHIGFFLPKVTRNRAIGLYWKQRETNSIYSLMLVFLWHFLVIAMRGGNGLGRRRKYCCPSHS